MTPADRLRRYLALALSRTPLVLAAIGIPMLACFTAMLRLEHFTREAQTYLTLFLTAFAFYGVAALIVVLHRRSRPDSRRLLFIIGVFAVLFRLPLWATTPSLSSDVWRYLWDGRLINFAANPYANAVDDPDLDHLATPLRPRVDHSWMATPYPPVAELSFATVYGLVPESPTAMQVASTLFDLATAAVIVILLRRLEFPPERVLLYAWNPLVIVEVAHGAHIDALMTLLVILALMWLTAGRLTRSTLALTLATLTKFVPALLLPLFIPRWGWRRSLVYAVLVGLAYVPFVDAGLGLGGEPAGTGIFGALRIYSAQWKTNDGLFYWLVRALSRVVADPLQTAKLISLTVVGATGATVALRSARAVDQLTPQIVIGNAVVLISIYLLLTPAMFPWYLVWLIALLPLLPLQRVPAAAFAIGWTYFAAAVNLSYLFYLDPANPREYEWVRRVEYLPLFACLGVATVLYVRVTRRSSAATPSNTTA
jgi:alpha-1,6-mannosyltransferase